MNWGRGLFRLWLIVSLVWVVACAIYGYSQWQAAARNVYVAHGPGGLAFRVTAPASVSQDEVLNWAATAEVEKKAAQHCDTHYGPWCEFGADLDMPGPTFDPWLILGAAIIVPGILYGTAFVVRWVGSGFKPVTPRQ